MKKLLALIAIAILTSITALAADTSVQARKVLDKAAAKVPVKSGASASFTVSGGKLGSQSGTIAVKGNKFNASTQNAIIWFNGTTQWLYNKKNDEVNVSTPSASQQQSMNPYTFLSLYKQGYTLAMDKTASGDYNIHLTGKGKSISEMYVLVDRSYNIKQVKMKQNNQWITIVISNLKAQSFPDSAFTFSSKDYPTAEVIDLR